MSRSSVELIQAEIADLAKEMDVVIDNVIGAVGCDNYASEFQAECFRDALKAARNHRYALESLSRQVGELFAERAAQRDLEVLKQAAAQREGAQ